MIIQIVKLEGRDIQLLGITLKQLKYIKDLMYMHGYTEQYHKYIRPNDDNDALSRLTKPTASKLIDGLKSNTPIDFRGRLIRKEEYLKKMLVG